MENNDNICGIGRTTFMVVASVGTLCVIGLGIGLGVGLTGGDSNSTRPAAHGRYPGAGPSSLQDDNKTISYLDTTNNIHADVDISGSINDID